VLHSFDDLPTVIYDDRHSWYQHGKKHRDNDRSADIYANGNQYWYKHGQLHRDNDRPAIVANGNQYWY